MPTSKIKLMAIGRFAVQVVECGRRPTAWAPCRALMRVDCPATSDGSWGCREAVGSLHLGPWWAAILSGAPCRGWWETHSRTHTLTAPPKSMDCVTTLPRPLRQG